MPDWLIPLLALLGGFIGSWAGMKAALATLQTQVKGLMLWQDRATDRLSVHNEDLLVHDIEIGSLMEKLEMTRAMRQRERA